MVINVGPEEAIAPSAEGVFVIIGRIIVVFLACGFIALSPSFASMPASQPAGATTQPAVDRSTPRASLISFFQAVAEGNSDNALGSCFATTEEERKLALAFTNFGLTEWQLKRTVEVMLGESARKELGIDPCRGPELEKGHVRITGDTAVVYSELNASWQMIRIDGMWYLSIEKYAAGERESCPQLTRGFYCFCDRNTTVIKKLLSGEKPDVQKIKRYLSDGTPIDSKAR